MYRNNASRCLPLPVPTPKSFLSHRQTISIPLEILDEIVDHAIRTLKPWSSTLSSLALVCHSFRIRVSAARFGSAAPCSGYICEMHAQRLDMLSRLTNSGNAIQTLPRLSFFITSFNLRTASTKAELAPVLPCGSLAFIFDYLFRDPKYHREKLALEIMQYDEQGQEWVLEGSSVKESFLSLLRDSQLIHLALQSIQKIPPDFLLHGSKLRHLYLQQVSLNIDQHTHSVTTTPLVVEFLQIDRHIALQDIMRMFNGGLFIMHSENQLNHLRMIQVEICGPRDVDSLNKFLRHCVALESLKIYPRLFFGA